MTRRRYNWRTQAINARTMIVDVDSSQRDRLEMLGWRVAHSIDRYRVVMREPATRTARRARYTGDWDD